MVRFVRLRARCVARTRRSSLLAKPESVFDGNLRTNMGSGTFSQKQALDPLERRSNLILYGVPEEKDISVVSDVLQAVAGVTSTRHCVSCRGYSGLHYTPVDSIKTRVNLLLETTKFLRHLLDTM